MAKPLIEKYREAPKYIGGQRIPIPSDLRLLSTLRDEIIHPLPYFQDIGSGQTVPDWLKPLTQKQLLIESVEPEADFHFYQKLGSYALAYWACETTNNAVQKFASSLPTEQQTVANWNSFDFYQDPFFVAPGDFAAFDTKFGLTLTN